jgi:hypothetical protein
MRAQPALIVIGEVSVFARLAGEKEGADVCRAMASSMAGLVVYGQNPVQG